MEEHFSLMIAVKKVTIVDFPFVKQEPSINFVRHCCFPVLSFPHFRIWFAGNFRRSDKLNDLHK